MALERWPRGEGAWGNWDSEVGGDWWAGSVWGRAWRWAGFPGGLAPGRSQLQESRSESGHPAPGEKFQLRPGLLFTCSGHGGGLHLAPHISLPSTRLLQFSYHNFDRSRHDDDDIRGCAVLDLASLQWVAMQCDTQLDWICKIPRGWLGWRWGTRDGAKGGGARN